jgi:hypothetical protein
MKARYYDSSVGHFLSEDPLFLSLGDVGRAGDIMDKSDSAAAERGLRSARKTGANDASKLRRLLSDPQQLNSYAYARNNPLALVDPSGLVGVGVTVGGTAEIGDYMAGAGATASTGGGVFWGSSTGFSLGGITSAGSFAACSSGEASYPSSPKNDNHVLGAYTGAGASIFLTNADSASDLSGASKTYSINLGFFLRGGTIQISSGKNAEGKTIWMFSYGGPIPGAPATGVGFGASASAYNTQTTVSNKSATKTKQQPQ